MYSKSFRSKIVLGGGSMNKYLEIIIYFTALIGYLLTEYTKIIKNEKLRKKLSFIFYIITLLILLYEFVLKKFI